MIDALYSQDILKLAANMPRVGRLPAPDVPGAIAGRRGVGEKTARLCGSTARIELVLGEDDDVLDYAQEVSACALGQSAAALLAQAIIGAKAQEVRQARAAMTAMLKFQGAGPEGRFEPLRLLAPVAAYPPRHGSVLVAFDAALAAIDAAAQGGSACEMTDRTAASTPKETPTP